MLRKQFGRPAQFPRKKIIEGADSISIHDASTDLTKYIDFNQIRGHCISPLSVTTHPPKLFPSTPNVTAIANGRVMKGSVVGSDGIPGQLPGDDKHRHGPGYSANSGTTSILSYKKGDEHASGSNWQIVIRISNSGGGLTGFGPEIELSPRTIYKDTYPSGVAALPDGRFALTYCSISIIILSLPTFDISSPPASPAENETYLVGSSPTGAWLGQAGKIAAYQNGEWCFFQPLVGWHIYVEDENQVYEFTGDNNTGFWAVDNVTTQATAIRPKAVGPVNYNMYILDENGVIEEDINIGGADYGFARLYGSLRIFPRRDKEAGYKLVQPYYHRTGHNYAPINEPTGTYEWGFYEAYYDADGNISAWTANPIEPTSKNEADIVFIDSETGFIVVRGNGFHMYKTEDGGDNWNYMGEIPSTQSDGGVVAPTMGWVKIGGLHYIVLVYADRTGSGVNEDLLVFRSASVEKLLSEGLSAWSGSFVFAPDEAQNASGYFTIVQKQDGQIIGDEDIYVYVVIEYPDEVHSTIKYLTFKLSDIVEVELAGEAGASIIGNLNVKGNITGGLGIQADTNTTTDETLTISNNAGSVIVAYNFNGFDNQVGAVQTADYVANVGKDFTLTTGGDINLNATNEIKIGNNLRMKGVDNLETTYPLTITNQVENVEVKFNIFGINNKLGISTTSPFTFDIGGSINFLSNQDVIIDIDGNVNINPNGNVNINPNGNVNITTATGAFLINADYTEGDRFRTGQISIAGESTATISPKANGGVIVIMQTGADAENSPDTLTAGSFAYDVGTTLNLTTLSAGANITNQGTTTLTGTTGTANTVSIAVATGQIIIENNYPSAKIYRYIFLL